MIREIDRQIKANEELAIRTLRELIAIQSDQAPAVTVNGEKYPFGRGVQDALYIRSGRLRSSALRRPIQTITAGI